MQLNRETLFPDGAPEKMQSRDLFFTNPGEWAATFQRLLQIAIIAEDHELFRTVLDEYAAVVGVDRTILEVMNRMDIMIDKFFREQE